MPWLNTFGVDLEYSNVTHPFPSWCGWSQPTPTRGEKAPSVGGCSYIIYIQYICFIYFLLFKVNLFCLDGKWGSDIKLRWISEIINIGTDIVVHIVEGWRVLTKLSKAEMTHLRRKSMIVENIDYWKMTQYLHFLIVKDQSTERFQWSLLLISHRLLSFQEFSSRCFNILFWKFPGV